MVSKSLKHIPYSQCKELIEKLEGLSSIYFRKKVKHIANLSQDRTNNKQLFYTIDILDEAIRKGKKVSFSYCEYGTDKKLHKRKCKDGNIRKYIISPYQLVIKEGKYYLICNYDKYNDISNYRIDRIADIKLLDVPAKPFEKLDGANKQRLDLEKYMDEHIYMYSSETITVKFRIVKSMISDIIDMFGMDVRFSDETDSYVTVTARVNEMAMYQFAKEFAPDVVVLSPQSVADKVKANAEKAVKVYNNLKGWGYYV